MAAWVRSQKKAQIWIDHDLSNEVQHVGSFDYMTKISHLGKDET